MRGPHLSTPTSTLQPREWGIIQGVALMGVITIKQELPWAIITYIHYVWGLLLGWGKEVSAPNVQEGKF